MFFHFNKIARGWLKLFIKIVYFKNIWGEPNIKLFEFKKKLFLSFNLVKVKENIFINKHEQDVYIEFSFSSEFIFEVDLQKKPLFSLFFFW